MKRFLIATTLILSTAGVATAQDASQLRDSVGTFLTETRFDVDMSTLTDEQVAKLHAAVTSSETEAEKLAAIRAVLAEENVEGMADEAMLMIDGVETPRDQVEATVANALIGTEFEGRAVELTDEEMVTAMSIIQSTDSEVDKRNGLVGVFN